MENIDKKIKICEILGAKQFQKIVFSVEKLKFKMIDKFFPNLENWYNTRAEKRKEFLLKNCKTEEEKNSINEFFQMEKMKFKKELIYKENRNYHINFNNPNMIKEYLNINKNIHKKSLIYNILLTSFISLFCLIFSLKYPILLYIFLTYQSVNAVIDLQCINLQNYNLYRLEEEKTKKIISKIEEKNQKEIEEKMSEGIKVISNTFKKSNEIPNKDDIINNVSSNEEKLQLLYYARKQLKLLQKTNEKNKVKTLKGKK